MTNYIKNMHIDFLTKNVEMYKNKSSLNKRNYKDLFGKLVELHQLPYPPAELQPFFLHPNIIADLLIEVNNSNHLTPDDRFGMRDEIDTLLKLIKRNESRYSIGFRILAPGGNYPNVELERGSCKYSIHNQLPILLPKNRIRKDFWIGSSCF